MSTTEGRLTVSYLVRCALPAGHSIAKQDANNNWYTYQGDIGVAPGWETGACDGTCQQAISACLMAHINTSGVHIPLWLVSPLSAIGWGTSAQYPNREGTFFGNLFTPNTDGSFNAFYCNGPGFSKDTVPGRLGVDQGNVPYRNPFITSTNTTGDCRACSSTKTDGPNACPVTGTTFSAPITVWRGQTFQAETASIKGGTAVSCPTCSAGKRLSNITSSTKISGIYSANNGSHYVIIYYTNGDTVSRSMKLTVSYDSTTTSSSGTTMTNSSISYRSAVFPPTGGWDKVGSVKIFPSGFLAGKNNSVQLIPQGAAPDLDWVEVE
jgi:hypothetical protein